MSAPVDLMELASELEAAMEGMDICVNTQTGEISFRSDYCDDLGDDAPDLDGPEWVWVDRPDADEDWRIMSDFAVAQTDKDLREDLLSALDQRRPFANFRGRLNRHGLWDAWYPHREAAYVDFTRAWLKQEGYAYTESTEPVV
jgi:hypothetical protein